MIEIIFQLVTIAAGLGGLGITLYITKKKHHKETLVCPIGSNCNAVVDSEFSKFLGIPLELLGMAYYGLIVVSYIAMTLMTNLPLSPIIFPMTLGAFLFSGYLTFIQAFTLRQWCTWCLSSAGLSTLIFLGATFTTDFDQIISFLQAIRPVLIGFHLLGLSLGLGAATMGDIFFFKFLKDLRISEREADTLRSVSQVVWFGLALLVISGVGIVLTDAELYLASAKFLTKMFVILVIILNGAFLNLYITPKLVHISFGDDHEHFSGELRHERGLAFASGAISVVSWYSAFVLGMLDRAPLPWWPMMVIYFVLLVGAVAGSQIMERRIAKRKPEPQNS